MPEEQKKRSVGLVILTQIPNKGLVAVLQRLGKFNDDKKWSAELYPGSCQITVQKKLEKGESSLFGLQKEIQAKFGAPFGEAVRNTKPGLRPILKDFGPVSEVEIFGIVIREEILGLAHLGPFTRGLDFVTHEESYKILSLKNFNRVDGVPDLKTIAMPTDEILAVQKAFEKFVKK